MIHKVDLGICGAYVYEGDGPTAVAVPGAMLGGMPALWFAFEPLVEDGWQVVLVWDEYLDRSLDHWLWVRDRAEAAIEHAGGAALLIGKSLGCYAAQIDLPAVWLTPALTDDELVNVLRQRTAPSMFVGGTADPMWERAVAHELGDVCELEGADHGLAHTSQGLRVGAAVRAFSGRLSRA